jgi:catechol 2,3-dioxygenase
MNHSDHVDLLRAGVTPGGIWADLGAGSGYHHHLGLNTWAGAGAPPPPPNSVGLRYFEIKLPNAETLAQITDRLRAAGVNLEEHSEGVLVRDPSQNTLLLALDS